MIHLEEAIVKSQATFEALQHYIETMASHGAAAHRVEQGLWDRLLPLGQALLAEYFARVGAGDVGDTVTVTDGRGLPRRGLQTKRYVSVFGPIPVDRMCYGAGKIEAVPLDAQLQLPQREYSYLLQDWSQRLAVQEAYGETVSTLEQLLHIGTTVRTLEQVNREVAASVPSFQAAQLPPDPATGGAVVVATVDGKGVPLCREHPAGTPRAHRRTKGEKAHKKKMACVGAVYTIAPFERTADDVLDEVLRHHAQQRRPAPQHKRVRAHLVQGKAEIFPWLAAETASRNPAGTKPVLVVGDGERAIWRATAQSLPQAIQVLDLFHVLEKLWLAAYCFHPEGSCQAVAFVEQRLRRLLQGHVSGVLQGLRQMATQHRLTGVRHQTIAQVTGYFQRNKTRMRYHEYLARGYPIGSGVAEGACRHLVKDRLERTGMRWREAGAQAMLDLRAVYLNHDWAPFWDHHITQQQARLYRHIRLPTPSPCRQAA